MEQSVKSGLIFVESVQRNSRKSKIDVFEKLSSNENRIAAIHIKVSHVKTPLEAVNLAIKLSLKDLSWVYVTIPTTSHPLRRL